ncbi:hypothetical protein B566_EDAN008471 [Ephemera danica]|nr:hypothetical protein B566_EDAN008471 [Ephemera danica]
MNLDAADSLRDADFNKFGTFLRSLWQPTYQYQSPTPTWRLWGEERVAGAIFTVYLKKVRYHRPNKSVSAQEDKISHLEWETVRVRHVKAATLVKLVECLASDEGELETTYVNIFLATYRSFSTPSQVLGLLLDRYKQLSGDIEELPDCIKEQHRKTLVLSLHVWLDTYPDDFRDPPRHPALRRLTEFCREHLPNSELCVKVQHRLERLLQEHPENMCPSPMHAGFVRGEFGPSAGPNLGANTCVAVAAADHDSNLRGEKPGGVGGLAGGAAGSVLATVNQFNAVSLRVISTMLASTQQLRSQVLTTWINIAQSNPVHRLRRTWGALGRDTAELFSELACIFSEENNQWAQRVLLMREGTAKFADTVGTNDRQLQKIIQKQLNNSGTISHGTIPYLGTFLTDLTMIDTAIPDTVGEEALINFDKRRKEFEVLAQIKLLQSASNAYSINPDPDFERWFNSVAVLDDREAYDISCQLEPPSAAVPSPSNHANTSLDSNKMKKRPGLGHKKNDSVASTNSGSSTSSHFYLDPPPPGDTSWRTQNSDRSGLLLTFVSLSFVVKVKLDIITTVTGRVIGQWQHQHLWGHVPPHSREQLYQIHPAACHTRVLYHQSHR